MLYRQQGHAFLHQIVAGDESLRTRFQMSEYAVDARTIFEDETISVPTVDKKSNGDHKINDYVSASIINVLRKA